MMQPTQAQNQINQQASETKLMAAPSRLEAKNGQVGDAGSNSKETKRMMKRLDDFEQLVREDAGMQRREGPLPGRGVGAAPAPPPPSKVAEGVKAWTPSHPVQAWCRC